MLVSWPNRKPMIPDPGPFAPMGCGAPAHLRHWDRVPALVTQLGLDPSQFEPIGRGIETI